MTRKTTVIAISALLALSSICLPEVDAGICQTDVLQPPGAPFANAWLGFSADADGEIWAIGAPSYPNSMAEGRVFVFRRAGDQWLFEQTLVADDPAFAGLGYSVAVFGDTIIAGAPVEGTNGPYAGAAYIFRHNGTSWVQEQKLLAPDGDPNTQFGSSVDIHDGWVAVGSNLDDDQGFESGSAYVFSEDQGSWEFVQKVLSSDGAVAEQFGSDVAINNDHLLVSAMFDTWQGSTGQAVGAVYAYSFDGLQWSEMQKINSSDPDVGDIFGAAVDMEGGRAVIGAYGDDETAETAGSAYIFEFQGSSWQQQQKLTARSSVRLGQAVALSGDTVVLGAPFEAHNDLVQAGALYQWAYDGAAWQLDQHLKTQVPKANTRMGSAVALSGGAAVGTSPFQGVIGALNAGAVYLFNDIGPDCNANGLPDECDISSYAEFDCNGNTIPDSCDVASGASHDWDFNGLLDECTCVEPEEFLEQPPLFPAEGGLDSWYGAAVALTSEHLIGGAWSADGHEESSGAAYAFRRSTTTRWTEHQKLVADDGSAADIFGVDVAIWGNTAVIGASHADPLGTNSGAAYVFTHDGTSWQQEQKLVPSDGSAEDQFGCAVAIDGNVIVVGAWHLTTVTSEPGSVYVFRHDGSVWVQEQRLLSPAAQPGDIFGSSVAISGDVLVVGAPRANNEDGAAYVYRHQGEMWVLDEELIYPDPSIDLFGFDVALQGDLALIGGPFDNSPLNDSGSAYAFTYDGIDWKATQKITVSSGQAGARFGESVAIDDDDAVIGAPLAGPPTMGRAYHLRRKGHLWEFAQTFQPPISSNQAYFGIVGLFDGAIAVGARFADTPNGHKTGAVYAYDRAVDCNGNGTPDVCDLSQGTSLDANSNGIPDECESPDCAADVVATGTVNVDDLLLVINSWGFCPGCPADITANGIVNVDDLLVVINGWGPCP